MGKRKMSVKSTKKMFNLCDFRSLDSHLLAGLGQESILIICTCNVQINVCPLFSGSYSLYHIEWIILRIRMHYTNLTIQVSHTVCVAGQSRILHTKNVHYILTKCSKVKVTTFRKVKLKGYWYSYFCLSLNLER